MIPLWLIRFGPYIAGVALAVFLVVKVYDAGANSERAKWQAKEAATQMALQEREDEMQAQVDAAGVALSTQSSEIERLSRIASTKTKEYYIANPVANVACLSDDRLRAIAESDAAYHAPEAASASPR